MTQKRRRNTQEAKSKNDKLPQVFQAFRDDPRLANLTPEEFSRLLQRLRVAYPSPTERNSRQAAAYLAMIWVNNFSVHLPTLKGKENEQRLKKILYDVAIGIVSSGLFALLAHLFPSFLNVLGGLRKVPQQSEPTADRVLTTMGTSDLLTLKHNAVALRAIAEDHLVARLRTQLLTDPALAAISSYVAQFSPSSAKFDPVEILIEQLSMSATDPTYKTGFPTRRPRRTGAA